MVHAMKMRSCSPHRQSVMSLWGFFRSLDGGEAAIDAGRLLSAKRFLLRWESRSALPRLHAHFPCTLGGVWVVAFHPSSCMSSDRSPVVCRSSVECTAAFDCTTRQQDISSSFSPARMHGSLASARPPPRLCLCLCSIAPLLLSDWSSCCPLAVLCPCGQLGAPCSLQVPPPTSAQV